MIPIRDTTDPRSARTAPAGALDVAARILDGLPAPALLLDENSRVVLANAGFVHLIGFAQSELIGRAAEEFLAGESREPIFCALHDNRQTTSHSLAEALPQLTVAHRDGGRTVLEVHLSPLELDGRRFLLCGFESVAARSSRNELARSEALLNAAQRIAKVGSWMWDVVNDWQWWSDEL